MGNANTEKQKARRKAQRLKTQSALPAQAPSAKTKQPKAVKPDNGANWAGQCMNCGESPTHPMSGMCGPCTFGEADTMGGNW